MENSDTLNTLRVRARERFGLERAEQLDPILRQVAADLDAIGEVVPQPDDAP